MNAGVARMDGWGTAGEVGTITTGIVSIGAVLRWVVTRLDRKQATREGRLNHWEESLFKRERAYREKIEGRLNQVEATLAETQRLLLEVGFELQVHAPDSGVLARVMTILKPAFPVDVETLGDMLNKARET